MTDEPRDAVDGADGGIQRPGSDSVRGDDSGTEVSAPWERPPRWQSPQSDSERVDSLVTRLGDDAQDSTDPTNKPDPPESTDPAGEVAGPVGAAAATAAGGAPPTPPGTGVRVHGTGGPPRRWRGLLCKTVQATT